MDNPHCSACGELMQPTVHEYKTTDDGRAAVSLTFACENHECP